MGKFKKYIKEQELNEYPHLATSNGAIDLFGELGEEWIDRFIEYSKKFSNDKKYIESIKNPFFKLFWDKKAKELLGNKVKEVLNKLPSNIKNILK